MHLQTISGCSVSTSYKISKMRANLLQIYLYPASIQYFMLCFVQRFHEHSKWKEAETLKWEKRSLKGYEVGGKGEREHLKADLGNMQGQHALEIVAVTTGFCFIYLWHWRWGRNNFLFSRNLLLDWPDTWWLDCFIDSTCSPCLSMWDLPGCVSVDVCWNLLNAAPQWLRSPGQCACALLILR